MNTAGRPHTDAEAELNAAIAKVLQSRSRRKLVVAGPGAGKTTLFRKLLEASPGDEKSRLVLTFINNLKDGLERDLAGLANIHTLHGYCQSLLHKYQELRAGLTAEFVCLPSLVRLIESDWNFLCDGPVPTFVDLMRNLTDDDSLIFYKERADFYDAISFDDSVYRTFNSLRKHSSPITGIDLILIDEYQDFNAMEAAVIELLATYNPILVAGDDDQALYSELRGASWDHIRSLYNSDKYERFSLPFCLRCPEVIVSAVNDVLEKARESHKLQGRIDKPYRHYEPFKGADSRQYPRIGQIVTSVQRNNANYFGQYIAEAIRQIPDHEIEEAGRKDEPVVLVIGGIQYRRQVIACLANSGYNLDIGSDKANDLERYVGLQILQNHPDSNLGWRIILHFENVPLARRLIREANKNQVRLGEVLPGYLRDSVLEEAAHWMPPDVDTEETEGAQNRGVSVKFTSFEGAKGLSAQHVFIIGMHAGDLPRDPQDIQDIEICKFIVGLTRAKKKCTLIFTRRFGAEMKVPSPFISWINPNRYESIQVNAGYWATR